MNEIHNRKVHSLENPVPGCMGRVVNLLDFGPRMTANKLLTDKPHSDDLARKMPDPSRDQLEGKIIQYESKKSYSKKKSNGTPMKMLIAHEMSKETESKQKPSNLVAKLMGLDALPEQQPRLTPQRSQSKGHLQNSFSRPGTPPRYLQHDGGSPENKSHGANHRFQDQQEYKDVYEVWQQSPKTSCTEHKSPEKARRSEKVNEKGMDLVRQKFIEAKRLATDENLRKSKEFQEALEVLSSNKELFLKFLQEPNSLFSQHLCELQSIPSLPHTKCITVLRPSKSLGNNRFVGYEETNQKPTQKQSRVVEASVWDKSKTRSNLFSDQNNDSSHPTRIVVLKPSPRKIHDVITVTSSPTLSPRHLHSKDYFEELDDDDDTQCSREVAKEITQQMRETMSSYPREDTLLSSVFSNGYVGDESSFHRSDNEYVGEGNLSDSEIMTPTSRVSWDYVNKFGSPYSSSFSRASYSPESSVCREAKKRLSERWAMMASNGNGEEQRQIRRSSSTLGEMLALSETKKLPKPSMDGIEEVVSVSTSKSFSGEQELRGSKSFVLNSDEKDEVEHDSPQNLVRSRSVPVSSTAYGSRLNVEVPDPVNSKPDVPTQVEKPKSVKSSFKGKVSSLFFSRNKKQKDKPVLTTSQDNLQSAIAETPVIPPCNTNTISEEAPLASSEASPPSTCGAQEAVLRPGKARNQRENHDQPSPVSILEAPFEDEDTTSQSSSCLKPDIHGGSLVDHRSLRSNLISKSPPIGSLARSLSWDDTASDLATNTPIHSDYSMIRSEIDEEQEWLLFIQKLLSSWHSSNYTLDPKLLAEFDKSHQWHETKRRQRRSNQKLIFDSVSEELVNLTKYGSTNKTLSAEEIWKYMREWFSRSENEEENSNINSNSNNSVVVERVVKTEVVGRGWMEGMRLEMDSIGKEIEGKVLEELVEDALTGWF